jgi:hypothetical protein
VDELASMISAEGISAGTRTMLGTVKNRADGGPVVTVGGSPIKARWLSGTVVNDGDTVLVQITNDAGGQRTSLVLGRVLDTPTPAVGTVTKTPSGAKTITVRAEWLGELEAAYLTTYTPAVGDQVMLIWHGSTPIAMGKRSAPPPAESQWPVPIAETRPGFITIRAIDSATWDARQGNTWDAYKGASVYQGTSDTRPPYLGTWWYGHGAAILAGRRVTSLRIRLARRKPQIGPASSAIEFRLAPHGLMDRASGRPTALADAVVATVPPNAGGTWHDLPTAWGPLLAAGGGIFMSGAAYGGVDGVDADPESGLLEAAWE